MCIHFYTAVSIWKMVFESCKGNTTGSTSESGNAESIGVHEFTPFFSFVGLCSSILIFCVVLCWLLFVVLFLLVSVMFPLQFADVEYPFVIFTMVLSRPLCCIPMLMFCCRCFTYELSCLSGLFNWVMVSSLFDTQLFVSR